MGKKYYLLDEMKRFNRFKMHINCNKERPLHSIANYYLHATSNMKTLGTVKAIPLECFYSCYEGIYSEHPLLYPLSSCHSLSDYIIRKTHTSSLYGTMDGNDTSVNTKRYYKNYNALLHNKAYNYFDSYNINFIKNEGDLKMKNNYYETLTQPVMKRGNYISRKFMSMIVDCEEYALNVAKDNVKQHFGKEFNFQSVDGGFTIIDAVTQKFIKKYDKKYERHIIKGNSDREMLNDCQFLIKFDNHTYAYVATGTKIGNIETRFLMSTQVSSGDIYIYIFGKHMMKYVAELEKITHNIYCSTELGIFSVDCANGGGYGSPFVSEEGKSRLKQETLDITYSKMMTRSLDTLFFSDKEKERCCQHIDKFNDNKEFYVSKQLLYKTGILLYGMPGTGKSSLVKALASKYNRSIVNINISNLACIDLTRLTSAINVEEQRQYIILLEDIDTLFLNRENGESDKDDQAIINKLLQFLDSNTSPTNVIFIATTNHIDRLDEALLREGRFDLKVKVNPLAEKEVYDFGHSFGLKDNQIADIIKDLAEQYPNVKEGNEQRYNQSSLQARILAKIENRTTESATKIYGEMEE